MITTLKRKPNMTIMIYLYVIREMNVYILISQDGLDSIPDIWKQKTSNYPLIIDQAQNLVIEKS